jgi:4-hydroxy-tetrahydrodipicolinate synthase
MDASGRLHPAGHERYLRHMAAQPVAGVAVWAHTGRGLRLDRETAATVLRDWRAALPDRVIIAGAGAIEMAEQAAQLGADAILAHPPAPLRGNERAILDHHQRLAQVGLPLVLFYLYEAAGGVSYSPELLDDLLALPGVMGIKMATLDSVMTYQDVARQVRQRHPDRLLITGEDRFLGYSLRCGARAALIGMGAVRTAMQAELVHAHVRGDTARFLELSDAADRLAALTFVRPMEGYIRRLLWVLVCDGVIPMEAAHDPWGPALAPGEFEKLREAL